MSYAFYKIVHVFGIAMMLIALGGVFVHAANESDKRANVVRKAVLILHGIGSILVLVAGFGLLAKLGEVSGFPSWLWPKLIIWLVLSGLVAVPYRSRSLAKVLLFLTPLLVLLAAFFAVQKPF